MTDVPPAAIEAALAVRPGWTDREWAHDALAAAAPLLAAAHEETISSLLATVAQAEGIIANRDREIEQLRNQLMALEVGP